MSKPILTIEQLQAGYGDLQILKDVSLKVETGTITILMGPNGAGKSTLLKSIFNITDITSGTVTFNDETISGLPTHELVEKGIVFVSQGRVNFSTLTVEDNLLLGAHHISDRAFVQAQLAKIYEQFPILKERRNEYAFSLSGGQQQMVAIGRGLMSNPKLMLMDEPSLGLAPKLVKETFTNIARIRDAFDTSIIIVEHNIKSLMNIADYGFILVQGEVLVHDTCENLQGNPIMKKVFVGEFE